MKAYLAIGTFLIVSTTVQAACNRPVDPKKIVLMMAFNAGSEEEKGAIAGACQRGETLVVVPKTRLDLDKREEEITILEEERERVNREFVEKFNSLHDCENEDCESKLRAETEVLRLRLEKVENEIEEKEQFVNVETRDFLKKAKSEGAKVSSLIISGHDGGGEFYGDNGQTTIADISALAGEHREVFEDMSSLLLMGCWSSTPDQIDQWKTIFPEIQLIGGFVGSAPASTRISAGTYVADLLKGQKNLRPNATKTNVQSMISMVRHLNMVTAGIYVNPNRCEPSETNPDYYYISPAQNENELDESYRPGLSRYVSSSSREDICHSVFGDYGSYSWTPLLKYYQGDIEPENNADLRSLYSFLRNNEHCFGEDMVEPAVTAEQVLFLRFFQDTKKNIHKYMGKELDDLYLALEKMVEESADPEVKNMYKEHKKLAGESLLAMTRKDTVSQISALQGIFDNLASASPDHASLPQIRQTMTKIDTYLYRLKCMSPTWHEYDEKETLSPPRCES